MTRAARAMTLVEVAASLAVASAVVTGLASAIVLMGRAVPTGDDPIRAGHAADELTQTIAADLGYALHFTERTATSAAFTVPDRDGDGSPEAIRYAWAGAGAPVTRSLNHAEPVACGPSVERFAFTWATDSRLETHSGPLVDSAESELFAYTNQNSASDISVDVGQYPGQAFRPALPAEAETWSVTRAHVYARDDGNNSDRTHVRLRPLDGGGLPTGEIIDEAVLEEYRLDSNYDPRELTFEDAGGLLPGDPLALTLEQGGSDASARVLYQGGGVSLSGAAMLEWQASDGWRSYGDRALLLRIFGRYTTQSPDRTVTRRYVVHAAMEAEVAGARSHRSLRLLNAPEDLRTFWHAEFTRDPTSVDLNGDGALDFRQDASATGGFSLNGNSTWNVNQRLIANPPDDLPELVTLEARLRDSTKSGEGVELVLCVGRSGSVAGVIRAHLRCNSDGSQTLTIEADPGGSQEERLVRIDGLGTEYLDIRLLADQEAALVNVQVDGVDYGTFSYPRTGTTRTDPLEIRPLNSENGVQVDDLRLRVGGTAS